MKTPGVILISPKFIHNFGAAIRACSCFGADSLVWTDDRISFTKVQRLPREERMKGYKHVEIQHNDKPLNLFLDAVPVCVEVKEQSMPLTLFEHPENAVYVFGPEDGHVPQVIRRLCHRFVHIPSHFCLNLAAAINVVLAHRLMTQQLAGLRPILPLGEMLHELRGPHVPTPIMDDMGWDGR